MPERHAATAVLRHRQSPRPVSALWRVKAGKREETRREMKLTWTAVVGFWALVVGLVTPTCPVTAAEADRRSATSGVGRVSGDLKKTIPRRESLLSYRLPRLASMGIARGKSRRSRKDADTVFAGIGELVE